MSSEVAHWISSETVTAASGPSATTLSEAVSRIPSRFGQLIALASLGRADLEQKGRVVRTVSEAWQSAFVEWLCLNLAEQKSDLDEHASWLGVKVSETLGARYLNDLATLVPADASLPERLLFLGGTRALFQLVGARRWKGRTKPERSIGTPAVSSSAC